MELPRLSYQPIQPTIQPLRGEISYREVAPDHRLSALVRCYWELRTPQPLDADFVYRVVADGCIDIFMEASAPAGAMIAGFSAQHLTFSLGQQFHYLGLRFLPTAFPQLFGVSAAALSGRVEMLHDVVPEMARSIMVLPAACCYDLPTAKAMFDPLLLSKLSQASFNTDGRLYRSLELIYRHEGLVRVDSDMETGISPRQLRRLFHFYIGDSPNVFCQVVRFQETLRAQQVANDPYFYLARYHDQAHFVKSYKRFAGLTPGSLAAK